MLWGKKIVVYTDHKNLIQDALGSTSNRVFRWRIILWEYGPNIIYIKVIHNTAADAISRLEFSLKKILPWTRINKTGLYSLSFDVKLNNLNKQKTIMNKTWIQTMCLQTTVTKKKYIL